MRYWFVSVSYCAWIVSRFDELSGTRPCARSTGDGPCYPDGSRPLSAADSNAPASSSARSSGPRSRSHDVRRRAVRSRQHLGQLVL